MKTNLALFLLMFVVFPGCDKRATDTPRPTTSAPLAAVSATPSGARFVHHGNSEWISFELDLAHVTISLVGQRSGEPRTFEQLDAFLGPRQRDFVVATNAGIFDPGHRPLGLHIQDGEQLVPLSTASGEGNFFLKPNGVFWIDEQGAHVAPSDQYAAIGRVILATQSGPLLLNAGNIHPAFQPASTSLRVRSGVGVNAQGHVLMALSRAPVTFHATATFFRDVLGCANALYLDGEISAIAAPGIPPARRVDYAGLLVVMRREK